MVKIRQGRIVVQIDEDMVYATFEVPENFGEIKPEDFAARNLVPAWAAILSHIGDRQRKKSNDKTKEV